MTATCPTDQIAACEDALDDLRRALQAATLRRDSSSAALLRALGAAQEAQLALLRQIPAILREEAQQLGHQRQMIARHLDRGVQAARSLETLNEKLIERQMYEMIDKVFGALTPQIQRRAAVMNSRYSWGTAVIVSIWAIGFVLLGVILGRVS